ncbi:MAG: PAS domain S-box protein [Planctomycetales bacterium]|nr:PAS domain S-box protein [Planctomycetales bacterium]
MFESRNASSTRILRVDEGTKMQDAVPRIKQTKSSHAAVMKNERCLGVVVDLDSVTDSVLNRPISSLLDPSRFSTVSEKVEIDHLVKAFSDSKIDALVITRADGTYDGIVTRQSLMEFLLHERVQRTCEQDRDSGGQSAPVEHLIALDRIFDHTLTPLAILDSNFDFLRVNRAYAEADGKVPSDFPGNNHFEFYPSDAKQIFEEVVQNQKGHRVEARPFVYAKNPERGVTYWDWILEPIVNKQGKVEFLLFSLVNVTHRVKAEREKRKLQHQINHMGRLQAIGALASGLSHELNQPLSAIANYATAGRILADKDKIDKEQLQKSFDRIADLARHTGEIIQRLRKHVQNSAPSAESHSIRNLIDEVIALFKTDFRWHTIDLNVHIDEAVPEVFVDGVQIQQVLVNLIQNALDSMATSSQDRRDIDIFASLDENNSMVKVSVRDSGSGFPDNCNPSNFFRPSFTTKPEGLGMGLSICASIIEANGGEIGAQPNDESGATFYFTLPKASSTTPQEIVETH